MSKKPSKKRGGQEPRAYIAKIKGGYLAVVEGQGEAEIKDSTTVETIKKLLGERRELGKKLSKLINLRHISPASIHRATIVLGDED